MFCEQCGTRNDDGARFCGSCGAPLVDPNGGTGAAAGPGQPGAVPHAVPMPNGRPVPLADGTVLDGMPAQAPHGGQPPVPMPGPVPSPSGVGANPNPAANGSSGTPGGGTGPAVAAAAPRNRKPLIIAIVAALAVVAAALVAFLTYRAEVWGGKTLPDPASIAKEVTDANGGKASAVKAKDVTDALKAKGLTTKTVKVYSGQDVGTFVGYSGAQQGQRVKAGSTVTVEESAGPGVPKGTVGKNVDQMTELFASMGVPIHYKKIIVTDTKRIPENQIVATSPADGQGVPEDQLDDGIDIGVAVKGDGIGADIIGTDKGKAQSDLESQGYDVTLHPRLAAKANVGKIVGSDPAPGSDVSSGASVTLYYGIDASGVKDAYTDTTSDSVYGDGLLGSSAVAAGTWCNNAGDCITFDAKNEDAQYGNGQIPYGQGRDGIDYERNGYDDMLIACDAVQQAYCSNKKAGYLIDGDTGAFELMPHQSLTGYFCGDDTPKGGDGSFLGGCTGDYGYSGGTFDFDSVMQGAQYRMQDMYVVVPVGAKLDQLEANGYFDKTALADAKKAKAVDTTRPFLLYRDPKQYDKTTVDITSMDMQNPFVPYNGYSGDEASVTKFKPAPTDASAYYLVGTGASYDWSSLPDAQVKQPSAKQSGNGSGGSAGTASFKAVADTYRWENGDGSDYTEIVVKADGTFSGKNSVANPGPGQSNATADRVESKFQGKFKSMKKNDAGGYDLQCDADALKLADSASGKSSDPYWAVDPCTTWHWYPAGTPYDDMNTKVEVKSWLVSVSGEDGDSWKTPLLINDGGKATFQSYRQ
ncbi:transmembrane serine/threonine- protein kinase B [Bifidobacterium parmae]|uniref:Transmembrane serine/threonine-protein kinase B n=2 Tax=Bifidobacterium parmae TaxID=361854 RepID=A0A2N5J0R3_9BIFI|nr:transmembrane serine/threonine- protein kinase B [Bifidobacterium parmae]